MAQDGRRLALLGGAGGIGRALQARATAEGWKVDVLDLPASLQRYPPNGRAIPLDLTKEHSVRSAFDTLGPVEGFVNLAGFMTGETPLEQTTTAEFDEVLAGNFRGAYLAAKAALPCLRAAGGGAMVNIVSGLGQYVRPHHGLYGASKAAMIHLTKTLALEVAPDIRVNAVGPGAVDTAFLTGGTGRSDEDHPKTLNETAYVGATPLRRMATPEDVVGPILFLLGPDSGFMTGQVLWVNGGMYMP